MKLPFDLDELPEGWSPVGAAVVVKCWDEQGRTKFATRYTPELNKAERQGMHDMALDLLVEDLVEEHIVGDDGAEEED